MSSGGAGAAASFRRLLVVLAVAAAGLVPAPAMAAGYCSGTGVNVVVDFGALGGGIQKGCDATGNRNAAKAFTNTGHGLTYAERQPGFVCRVDGVPQSDPCVNASPADAYWGLYWSDGTSGWKYASTSVGSLTIPAGGTVAFSWQNGGGDPPGTAPAASAAPPPATSTPTRQPTARATTKVTTKTAPKASAGVTATAASRPSASASASAVASGTRAATASPSLTPTPSAAAATSGPVAVSEPQAQDLAPAADDGAGHGLPWWVPVLVLLALAGSGAAVRWRRRGTS